MILTRLFLFLAAVGIAAAEKNRDPPPDISDIGRKAFKDQSGVFPMIFKFRVEDGPKPDPTVEFDTPKDCNGRFPEYYRSRNGKFMKVWCLRDHWGHDYATLRVQSYVICAEVCSTRVGCVAFSFTGVAKKGSNCWLKKHVNQAAPKSVDVWSGTMVSLKDIPAPLRKQWETLIAPRQTEPYRLWFSTGMSKKKPDEPATNLGLGSMAIKTGVTEAPPKTTMAKKDGYWANAPPGAGGPEVTLSNLDVETTGLITDAPKPTVKPNPPGSWGFAFDSGFISKLKSQVANSTTPSPSTTWKQGTLPRHDNAPPTGTIPPSTSRTETFLEVYPIQDAPSRSLVTPTPSPPPLPPPPPPPPAPPVAAPLPVIPAITAQSSAVAPSPAAPGVWVIPKIQSSVLDCYNCGWEAPRAALPGAINFFCEGGHNKSFGSIFHNQTLFSSKPLGLVYWSKDIPLLRFLVTPHLNTSLFLRQPGYKERCVDNLSRAINDCDAGSKNRTTRGGFVIDDMARWGIDPQPMTRVTDCDWHEGNGTENPWCTTWHKEPAASQYDMVTVRCLLQTAALHY